MLGGRRYPAVVEDRSVRMVAEIRVEDESEFAGNALLMPRRRRDDRDAGSIGDRRGRVRGSLRLARAWVRRRRGRSGRGIAIEMCPEEVNHPLARSGSRSSNATFVSEIRDQPIQRRRVRLTGVRHADRAEVHPDRIGQTHTTRRRRKHPNPPHPGLRPRATAHSFPSRLCAKGFAAPGRTPSYRT